LGIITFHSGEDRIVKDYFREKVEQKVARYITEEKYIEATEPELTNNKRSHSAKLRIVIKN
jgi:16S rRNA C1402 N4-methylase RsmH